MQKMSNGSWLLRIYCGEDDRLGHTPLHEAIVLAARDAGLAGATVLKGSMGFGADHRIHTARVLRLAEGLPVVIEVVDSRDSIDTFLPKLREMMTRGLVTLERVEILLQSPDPG